MRLVLGALLAAFALPACGGGEEPTRDDREIVTAILTSGAAVQRAFQPLYGCVPERPRCYTRSGPNAAAVVAQERKRIAAVLPEVDTPCLQDAGGLFAESLDTYTAAADAAVDGRAKAFDAAISRSTGAEIAYTRKLDDCGFSEGKTAEINSALREVNIDLLRLGEEIVDCADRACVVSAATRMEESAKEAARLVEGLRDELGEDAPSCLTDVLDEMRESYSLLVSSAAAIQDARFGVAERDGTRSAELQAEALDDMASCFSSLGG